MRRISALVAVLLVFWNGAASATVEPGTRRALLAQHNGFPTIVDTLLCNHYNSPASCSWTSGAPPAPGLLLVVNSQGNGSGAQMTPPSGWNTLYNTASVTTSGLFWKISQTGEPLTTSWPNSGNTAGYVDVVGVSIKNAALSLSSSNYVFATVATTSGTAGPITPRAGNGLMLVWFDGFASTSYTAFTTPSGWTAKATQSANSNQGYIGLFVQNSLTPSSTAAISATSTGTATGVLATNSLIVYIPWGVI